jgi:DNA ligase-associated metallophosphoesterase
MSAARSAAPLEDSATVLMRFAGHNFEALSSGALHWPAQKTLLVADLHLEKLSSYARRGSLLPPYDTSLTLKRLADDLERTGATEIIALGDSFHRDEGTSTLLPADRLRLMALLARARWTWIGGNHDPTPHTLGGTWLDTHARAGLTFAHEPRRGLPGLLAGHLHPAARVAADGRSVRRPCFVHDGDCFILPAYGASTGSINILSAPFLGVLDFGRLEVAMIGRGRVYPVSPRRLIGG